MSLSDKALIKASTDADKERSRRAALELNQAQAQAKTLERTTGYPVTLQGETEVTASRFATASWSGKRVYEPILVKKQVYLIDDIRLVTNVQKKSADLGEAIVRPCVSCTRLACTGGSLAFPETYGYKLPSVEELQEKFIVKLGRALLEVPKCTFCVAAEEAVTCPACHRGYDR